MLHGVSPGAVGLVEVRLHFFAVEVLLEEESAAHKAADITTGCTTQQCVSVIVRWGRRLWGEFISPTLSTTTPHHLHYIYTGPKRLVTVPSCNSTPQHRASSRLQIKATCGEVLYFILEMAVRVADGELALCCLHKWRTISEVQP